MSFFTEKQGEIEHEYFQAGPGKKIYLGRKDKPGTAKLENIRKALGYLNQKNQHYLEITDKLISKLSPEDRDEILPEIINELYKKADTYIESLSDPLKQKYLSRGKQTAEDQTRLRPLTKIQPAQNLSKTRVVVYGLSTEGYHIACQTAMRGANTFIIDESSQSAISLKPEIAKTYPHITSLKQDEPMLAMEPIDKVVSKAQYLFFAPRIRKTGQKSKIEVQSKFKDATASLKKGTSVIYVLPTGIGGNDENISILEHVTGFEIGKSIFYYYYPLTRDSDPSTTLGTYNDRQDPILIDLLGLNQKEIALSISNAERVHAINILSRFSFLYDAIKRGKPIKEKTKTGFDVEYENIFLDDMIGGLYDLRLLMSSLPETDWLMGMAKDSIKAIDDYIKHLLEAIRESIKKNNLKPEMTRVALVWSIIDMHEMRGDKLEMLQNLITTIRDVVGEAESFDELALETASDKHTILVVCSKKDYEDIKLHEKLPRTSLIASPIVYPK